MAQQTIVKLVDDVNGKEADETLEFAFDGKTYEIDLSQENADTLRTLFEPYVKAGRHLRAVGSVKPRGAAAHRVPARADKEQTQAIRDWARGVGIQIAERGRIPGPIREAYNATGASRTALTNDILAAQGSDRTAPEEASTAPTLTAVKDDPETVVNAVREIHPPVTSAETPTDDEVREWFATRENPKPIPEGKKVTAAHRKAYLKAHAG